MRPGAPIWVATRLLLAAFGWMTAGYALVASSTFAYLQFLRPRVWPALSAFGDWHVVTSWAWLGLLVAHVSSERTRSRGERLLAYGLIALGTTWGVWSTARPVLPELTDSSLSLAVGALWCVPAIGLSWLDHVRSKSVWGRVTTPPGAIEWPRVDTRLFLASVVSAVGLTAVYAMLAVVRLRVVFEPELLPAGIAEAIAWSLLAHTFAWTSVFLGLAVASRLGGRSLARQCAVVTAAALVGLVFLWDRVLSSALGLSGAGRLAADLALAMSVLGTWSGIGLARLCARETPLAHGLDVYLGVAACGPLSTRRWLVAAATVGGFAWGLMALASIADWDHLLLECGVLTVWIAVFGWGYRLSPERRPMGASLLALVCVAPLAARLAIVPSANQERLLSRYAAYDPSFRAADGLRRQPAQAPAFTKYLRANTGLTALELEPVSIDLVTPLTPAAVKPSIFLFVVDSLRHDYLKPYNPAAFFTPRIAEFAEDSIVFTNAFTRYGGTGLSVPAIWAGSVLPHKQYVEPFHPMNALEKLLDANGYRRLIGLDSVMGPLLRSSPLLDELDRGVTTMDYELCRTLGELEQKLSASPASGGVFAYSLPQDVHMSRVSRWATPSEDFTGFFAPYAGRVQVLDGCFGAFVDALRRLGLYDSSLIVLTSDHGEMLGEDAQYGHSYHMYPQVVRVPLVVHVPAHLGRLVVDPDALSLTTDITPTIYAALGYHPTDAHGLAGRPLFGQSVGEQEDRRRGSYVLAASYGAVYAVVDRNGRRLYVADAVKDVEHLYERSPGGAWAERRPSADLRARAQFAIRRHVDAVARLYMVPEQP